MDNISIWIYVKYNNEFQGLRWDAIDNEGCGSIHIVPKFVMLGHAKDGTMLSQMSLFFRCGTEILYVIPDSNKKWPIWPLSSLRSTISVTFFFWKRTLTFYLFIYFWLLWKKDFYMIFEIIQKSKGICTMWQWIYPCKLAVLVNKYKIVTKAKSMIPRGCFNVLLPMEFYYTNNVEEKLRD